MKKANLIRYLKFCRYLFPFWKKGVLALIFTGSTMLLDLANPFLAKLIIDKAYRNRDLKLFVILIAIGGIVFLLNSIFVWLANYLNRYIALRVNLNLNRDIFKKLQRLPYGFFQESSTGENLYKLNFDVDVVTRFITDALPKAVYILPRAFFILGIVFYLNFRMALLVLILMPFLLVPYYFVQRFRKALKGLISISQGIFSRLQEVLSHIQLVKAFGKETYQIRCYTRSLIEQVRAILKNHKLELTGTLISNLANRIILGLITLFGGYLLIKDKMTLGDLSAISIYLNQLAGLQMVFVSFFQQINSGALSCDRLESIMNAQIPMVLEDKTAKEISFSKARIEFKNIFFAYQKDRMVLEDLSFTIEGGSCIALVGNSGCGKTTLINLLLRLYNLNAGRIMIDGQDIKGLRAKSLYEQIGVVLQEPYLWNDTVENNIKYGKQDADSEQLIQAAKLACIDGFINTLPLGFSTVIGENACKISEGQKQRMAIARAVIKQPKILIMDEALSSVDARIEAEIINNIRKRLRGSTIIVISHRLSAIEMMDSVFFLYGTNKIDISSHQDLLKTNSQYQSYLAHQIK